MPPRRLDGRRICRIDAMQSAGGCGDMGPHKWTCAILNPSHQVLGTGKAVKVVAAIDGVVVETSMLPHKGGHMLAIKQSIQDSIGKHAGDIVAIRLREPGS